jgi:RNA polymerase sigma factor (sigma-70 family)
LAAEPSVGRASLVEAPRVAPHAAATHGLYERHAAKIQSYCQHQLGSREEAEDAVQTTFMNAFRALGRGVVPEAEAAWLFKIAENVCLSRRRSSWRRGKIESPSDFGVIEEIIPGPNRQRDELIGIEDALAAMPEQQRRAILLREWQGLSYREVADELEISQSAVETLIFRARRSLAQGLEEPERTKPKRKSFRRALHAFDFGTIAAAVKTVLAGSAAVKATAAAVAVTAAAGTVATVAPKIEPRSPHLAAAPKHVVAAPAPAPAPAPAEAATGFAFAPAAVRAGESAPKPAVAEPKRALQPTAESRALPAKPGEVAAPAPPGAAAPAHENPAAEPPAEAPTPQPQPQPPVQPVVADLRAAETRSDEGKDERHTEGVAAVVPAASVVQPVPVQQVLVQPVLALPKLTLPVAPTVAAPAPVAEVQPAPLRIDLPLLSVVIASLSSPTAAPAPAVAPAGPVTNTSTSPTSALTAALLGNLTGQ